MTVLDEKRKMIASMGFEDVSEKVLNELKTKTTKAAEKVLRGIDLSDYFEVYAKGDRFTIYSQYYITQSEIKQFTRILKKDYIGMGQLLGENGLWEEWIKIGKYYGEE